MANENLKEKVAGIVNNVKYYWKEPPKGRYMSFKEIASYAFGGIGFYLIVCMSYTCLLGATNVFISGTIGIGLTDMYIMYVIAVLTQIPLTGLRANIVDNSRNKAGKYRPYIIKMGIPTVILFVGIVWFPYDKLHLLVGTGEIFGKSADYIAKCAVLLLFNILLQFFYYFFYDAYENLIHVLSPNSQERADVASIKSIIYSLGPSLVNILMPLIAQNVYHTNQTDIRVYRLAYPILGIVGILLLIIVYANTQEKIIQAKTHVIQIKFTDALREVAKNKYFWIISMATWIGFLETAYSNILYWLCNYGGACSNNVYAIITTINGNAALWGMILAPFCIRKWGKKIVQIVTNLFNIAFILMMLPFVSTSAGADGNIKSNVIWCVLACLFFNGVVGAFAHILNPSIQADIRDYQQYKSGERIDGMFAAVATIGNIITLITAGVIPALQESLGMTKDNAVAVTSNASLMSRILPGTKESIGELLNQQLANGQDNFVNPSSALYDVNGVLIPLLRVLVIVAAIGATLNVIPFFFYDLTEKKQKGIINVLKIRALFEDYGNNALKNKELVETIDLVNDAREMANAQPKEIVKSSYTAAAYGSKKAAKAALRADNEFNENIDISKFVCKELDKFSSVNGMREVELYTKVYEQGLNGIVNMDVNAVKAELAKAKALPKNTEDEKELRKMEIELAKNKLSAKKSYDKHFGSVNKFVEPKMSDVTDTFDKLDALDQKIRESYLMKKVAKKNGDTDEVSKIQKEIKSLELERNNLNKQVKSMMDEMTKFNRAAKPYIDARKLLVQQENYSHFDEIAALYDEAKIKAEEEEKAKAEETKKRLAEEKAELERKKAEKAARKNKKK